MSAVDNRSLLEIASRYVQPGLGVAITLEGLPPGFLMHNPDAMQLQEDAAEAARRKGLRDKFIPTKEQETEWGTYRLEGGELCLPAHMLHRCLVEAAKHFKVPKSRSSFMSRVAGSVKVPVGVGFGWPLLDPKTGKKLRDAEPKSARVVISRSAVIKARPLVPKWKAEVALEFDPESVTAEMLAEMVGLAGVRQGIGDWRPEKGGVFGQFKVTKFDVTGLNGHTLIAAANDAATHARED